MNVRGWTDRWRCADAEIRLGGVLLALAVLLPVALPDWQVAEFARYFCYTLFAASLAWVWGHCGLLCLGQAVFFGIGAYAMGVITLGKVPGVPEAPAFWIGVVAGTGLAGLAAGLLGALLFSARGLAGAFFGIVTLAVAFIVERIAINWDWLGGLNGLMGVPSLRLSLTSDEEPTDEWAVYYLLLAVLAGVVAALMAAVRSRRGRVLMAIRNHELRAQALGIDTAREKTRAFAIGGGVAGLAGALFVTQFNFVSPPLIGFTLSAEVLIWVAVGGRASIVAACSGAFLVRLAETWLSEALGPFWLLALGALFIVTVLLMPRGVVGELLAWMERRQRTSAAVVSRAG